MPLNPEERVVVARRLSREIRARFGDTKKKGYDLAGVNPQTLQNALDASPIKDRSLNAIVAAWWPETEGDWRQIPDLDPRSPRERYRDAVSEWDLDEETRKEIQRILSA